MEESQTDLIVKENINVLQVFTDKGIDPILAEITSKVRSFVPDISTIAGRKEIASLANKVARSKTMLDGMGKDLVADWKSKAKVVDSSRKKMRDTLDSLKNEARAPLTEWEDKQNQRLQDIKELIQNFRILGTVEQHVESGEIHSMIEQCEGTEILPYINCEEVNETKAAALVKLNQAFNVRKKFEDQEIELEQLRKEKAERDEKQRQDRESKEAAAKEKIENQRRARREKERIEEAKQNEVRAKEAALQKAKEEKQKRIDSEKKAKADAKVAEQRRKDDVAKAKKEAQEKIDQDKKKALEEQKKREANKKHRKMINNAALKAMAQILERDEYDSLGSDELSRIIVEAIAKRQIPHVTITY